MTQPDYDSIFVTLKRYNLSKKELLIKIQQKEKELDVYQAQHRHNMEIKAVLQKLYFNCKTEEDKKRCIDAINSYEYNDLPSRIDSCNRNIAELKQDLGNLELIKQFIREREKMQKQSVLGTQRTM